MSRQYEVMDAASGAAWNTPYRAVEALKQAATKPAASAVIILPLAYRVLARADKARLIAGCQTSERVA